MATVASLEAKRRRHIIDSTIRVLVRDGVADTSLSRVAREAGVAKGIICYYFKSKDQLFDAVLVGIQDRTMAAAIADAERADDPWARIAAFIAAHLQPTAERRMEVLALRHLACTTAGGSAASDHLATWREQQAWLEDELMDGQCSGSFKRFDAEAVSSAICGALDSMLLQWANAPAIDLAHRTGQLLALFEPGICRDEHVAARPESHLPGDGASIQSHHGAP